MAVVQISKIQVRRGRKNGESGVPQLSSGEMAWTVDTQELFIGNGSVAEGAPAVGNSKILTEHDNLLELIESYRWARSSPSITRSVFRTLQAKLDDRVNVKDFGAKGDGVQDDTAAFQNALNQLYRNTSIEFRKQLFIPTGHYNIAGVLRIPTGAILDGESQLGTILLIKGTHIEYTSYSGTTPSLFSSSDRPQAILVQNLTFRFAYNSGSGFVSNMDLTGVANTRFSHVNFQGPDLTLSDATYTLQTDSLIIMSNTNNIGSVVDNIVFDGCHFEKAYQAVKFTQTNTYPSNVYFTSCRFNILNNAIMIDGPSEQLHKWTIVDCVFDEISTNAISSLNGSGMKVSRSKFTNCGNGINTSNNPESYIISFAESLNNIVEDCSFDRQQAAYTTVLVDDQRQAFSEVFNAGNVSINDQITQDLTVAYGPTPLALFSTLNRMTVLEYVINYATNSARYGVLTITVGDNTINPVITDSYSVSQGDTNAEGIEFSVALVDRSDSTLGSETMVLRYVNPNNSGTSPDTMTYFVRYGV
jgi:Pectate lyase superfamily protein/Major tropism determinant N-terminal domain